MEKTNGTGEISRDNLSYNEKLDLILGILEEVQLQQEEIIEKLGNVGLPGADYGIDYDS